MSDCTMYEPLLHLLLDGEISPAERADLEAHLAACPACRERLEQLEAVRGAFALLDAEVPAGLRERAMAAVRLEVRRERRRRLGRLARGLGALAACCVLAFLGLRLRGGTKGDSVLPGSADYSGGAYQDQALPPEEDGAPMLYMNGGGLADGAEPAAFPQYAEPEGSAGQEMEKDSLDGVEAPAGTRSIGEETLPGSADIPSNGGDGVSDLPVVETGEAAAADWLAENRPGEGSPFELSAEEAEALAAYLAQRGIDLPLSGPVTLVLLAEAE